MTKGVPYQPTDKDRQEIKALIGMGLTVQQVAHVKGLSHDTLQRHHRDDIDQGKPLALAKVVDTAFKLATNGKCPAMTMFWLKTQAGWREKNYELGNNGKGGESKAFRAELLNEQGVQDDFAEFVSDD